MTTLGMKCLQMLMNLPGFKIEGYNLIEADGIKFDGSYLYTEEALFRALIYIEARRELRAMINNNEIKLSHKNE
jgi:hypothetical protein